MMTYTQNETDKTAPAVGQSTGVDLSKAALVAKSALGAVGARRVTIQKPLMKIQQTHRVEDGEKITDSLTLPPHKKPLFPEQEQRFCETDSVSLLLAATTSSQATESQQAQRSGGGLRNNLQALQIN